MDMRERLRKAAGLFVELPPEDRPQPHRGTAEASEDAVPSRTVEEIVRESAGPNLEDIKVPSMTEAPTVSADGKADFAAIYQQAGLPAAPFSAEQMRDMLQSLPPELPLSTKRQTVAVTLGAVGKSIGATPETIVADASRKLAALAAYTDSLSKQTADAIAAGKQQIEALEAQIADQRRTMGAAQERLAEALKVCHAESDELDDVLEFFSLDVPPSKHSGSPTGAS
jgi:hypothetical protein